MASCVLKYGDGIMPTIGAFHHAHLLTCYGASRPLYLYLHFRRRLGNPDSSSCPICCPLAPYTAGRTAQHLPDCKWCNYTFYFFNPSDLFTAFRVFFAMRRISSMVSFLVGFFRCILLAIRSTDDRFGSEISMRIGFSRSHIMHSD